MTPTMATETICASLSLNLMTRRKDVVNVLKPNLVRKTKMVVWKV